jgi:4-aminobutyrate aminotransferase / (S)-3-amino-2-methylpropionate transaminase / 5-aminovalerate transaminase
MDDDPRLPYRSGQLTEQLAERRRRAVPRGLATAAPVFAARGSGAQLEDVEGRQFIDFAGGIGVLNVGQCHPHVVGAVVEQAQRYLHTSTQVVMHEPYVALAERLNALVPGTDERRTLLVNSGAEAVENAVKIARAATGRPAVIAFEGAFHGRTLLGLSLTGRARPYKGSFGPFAPEIYHAPFPYEYRGVSAAAALDAVERVFVTQVAADRVAAIIVEPVLGEGGFVPAPAAFLQGLAAICRREEIVLIVDEIQTGFGRTGRMFAIEHSGVEPDVLLTGKSLAAGLPLAGVTGRASLMDAVAPGGLGATYGGNPVACAAGLAVLDVFARERLVARAAALGERLAERLDGWREAYPLVGDSRGLGAMRAVELVADRATREPAPAATAAVVAAAQRDGLLVLKAGLYDNVVRVLVPLVIGDAVLTRGLDVLEHAIREASGQTLAVPAAGRPERHQS